MTCLSSTIWETLDFPLTAIPLAGSFADITATRASASVDQLIADHAQGDSPHRSLELTTEGLFVNQIGCSYISYDKKGGMIPRESDPQLVFDKLFRNP